jgi:hypothetical protein
VTERDWESEFWDIVVEIAAEDDTLTNVLARLLMQDSVFIDDGNEDVDNEDMRTYLHYRYGLSEDRHLDDALELCEARLLGELYGNEA